VRGLVERAGWALAGALALALLATLAGIVAADNVTIDLMGFTVSGPAGNDGRGGIAESGSRYSVKVRNGVLRDWGWGIKMSTSGAVSVEDMRILQNFKGIAVGTGGVLAGLVVRDNVGGIEVYQYPNEYGTDIRDSVISENSATGIFISSANNVWVHDNVIDVNSTGVYLYNSSSWNKVTDNRIGGNDYGILIGIGISNSPANVNMVARNQIVGSATAAVSDHGTANRIGTFVGGDASITATNPWSNVVY
jgi:parallel beta-helix repeat protein